MAQTAQYTSIWTLSTKLAQPGNRAFPQRVITSPNLRVRISSPLPVALPRPCSSSAWASSDSGSMSSTHDHVTTDSCKALVAVLLLCTCHSGRFPRTWLYMFFGSSPGCTFPDMMGGSMGRRAHRGNGGATDLGDSKRTSNVHWESPRKRQRAVRSRTSGLVMAYIPVPRRTSRDRRRTRYASPHMCLYGLGHLPNPGHGSLC